MEVIKIETRQKIWQEQALKQLESLQNAVNYSKSLEVSIYIENDQRKNPMFILSLKGVTISPVLNYDKMNHFLLGFNKCIKLGL
jgi:hypothetical protein